MSITHVRTIARSTTTGVHFIWRNGVCDLLLIAIAFMFYSIVRQGSSHRQIEATYNAVDLVELQRNLHVAYEARAQELILWSGGLVQIFNTIYTYGHFWLIGIAAIWLFFKHRRTYVLFRNAFFISGAIALLSFNLFPLAPPRLLPGDYGAVDTLRLSSSVNYETSGNFVNEYAAMPSLHIAWNLLICLAIASTVRHPIVRGWAFVMPLIMSITVVVTGNHWILDAVAGYIVGMFGLGAAILIRNEGWRVRRFVLAPVPAEIQRQ